MQGSVLVIENEEPARQLLAGNLQHAGYKVECAGDIPQAEALMRVTRPDLVVLNWILPGVPGLPFARRLRKNSRMRAVIGAFPSKLKCGLTASPRRAMDTRHTARVGTPR